MIEFAKITGKTKGNLYQVKRRTGEHFYAPIAVTGMDVPIPSQKWIDENKDSFLALLTYEGKTDNSFIIGFYPVKGANSENYNLFERLLSINMELVELLLKAKTNTAIGPMPFMPNTIQKLTEIKTDLEEIENLIKPLKDA